MEYTKFQNLCVSNLEQNQARGKKVKAKWRRRAVTSVRNSEWNASSFVLHVSLHSMDGSLLYDSLGHGWKCLAGQFKLSACAY